MSSDSFDVERLALSLPVPELADAVKAALQRLAFLAQRRADDVPEGEVVKETLRIVAAKHGNTAQSRRRNSLVPPGADGVVNRGHGQLQQRRTEEFVSARSSISWADEAAAEVDAKKPDVAPHTHTTHTGLPPRSPSRKPTAGGVMSPPSGVLSPPPGILSPPPGSGAASPGRKSPRPAGSARRGSVTIEMSESDFEKHKERGDIPRVALRLLIHHLLQQLRQTVVPGGGEKSKSTATTTTTTSKNPPSPLGQPARHPSDTTTHARTPSATGGEAGSDVTLAYDAHAYRHLLGGGSTVFESMAGRMHRGMTCANLDAPQLPNLPSANSSVRRGSLITGTAPPDSMEAAAAAARRQAEDLRPLSPPGERDSERAGPRLPPLLPAASVSMRRGSLGVSSPPALDLPASPLSPEASARSARSLRGPSALASLGRTISQTNAHTLSPASGGGKR